MSLGNAIDGGAVLVGNANGGCQTHCNVGFEGQCMACDLLDQSAQLAPCQLLLPLIHRKYVDPVLAYRAQVLRCARN